MKYSKKEGDATVKTKRIIALLCLTLFGSFCGTVDSAYANESIKRVILAKNILSLPTLTSCTVQTTGTSVICVFSQNMSAVVSTGWTLNTPTDVMTYSSGTGTSSITFTTATTINSTDTPTVSYTQPGTGWTGAGGYLASITNHAVTNNSTQGGADSCTAGLLFSWHAEDTTVTTGTPAGCSVGDTTATLSSATISSTTPYDGTNALAFTDTSQSAEFTIATSGADGDIIHKAAGTTIIYIRKNTAWWSGTQPIMSAEFTSGSYMLLESNSSRGYLFSWNPSGSLTAGAYSDNTLTYDAYLKISLTWSVAAVSGHHLGIRTGTGAWVYDDTALTGLTGTSGTLGFGNGWSGGANVYKFDAIQVWDSFAHD